MTSLFAGVAVFAMLGHKARRDDKDVADVVASGEGLAFVAYPDGLATLPAAGLWCFLFFVMLFALALDSGRPAWVLLVVIGREVDRSALGRRPRGGSSTGVQS